MKHHVRRRNNTPIKNPMGILFSFARCERAGMKGGFDMKIYYTFQTMIIVILVVISIISFWTNNVADAIYFMVAANFILLTVWMAVVRRIRQ